VGEGTQKEEEEEDLFFPFLETRRNTSKGVKRSESRTDTRASSIRHWHCCAYPLLSNDEIYLNKYTAGPHHSEFGTRRKEHFTTSKASLPWISLPL